MNFRQVSIHALTNEWIRSSSITVERLWTWLLIGDVTTPVPGLVLATRGALADKLRLSQRVFEQEMRMAASESEEQKLLLRLLANLNKTVSSKGLIN